MTRTLTTLSLLALASCGWNDLPHQQVYTFQAPLWDASSAVARVDGLYLHLPVAGALVRVNTDGSATRVDVGEGRVTRVLSTPDDRQVLAFVEQVFCDLDPDELSDIHSAEECPGEAQEIFTELLVVEDATVQQRFDIANQYNALSWSEDGRFAIAYLDLDQEVDLDALGVVDLTSVLVLDMDRGTATPVSVGFAADRVLFTHTDADGDNPDKAVVLSQSEVSLVDLDQEVPSTEVRFKLTLDPDQTVTPVGVALTPDNHSALITTRESSDLYVLDLEDHAVNIVSLSSSPAAMAVDEDADRTVLVYADEPVADILDHTYYDVDTVDFDEPTNTVLEGTGFSLLYNTSDSHAYHDVVRLDLSTGAVLEYRLQNPLLSLHLTESEEYAIALTRAEGGNGSGIEGLYDATPGMEILDLRDPQRAHSTPYMLESPAVGIAFSQTETALHALVLQQGVDYLYELDLYTGEDAEIELDDSPVSIGAMPEGGFYITYEAGLGHVSFYDPVTDELSDAFGFAELGLFDEYDILNAADTEEVE